MLSKRVRKEHSRALKDFYGSSRDERGMFEASGFAAMLVGAIFFTVLFLALLIMEIVARL